MSTRTEIEALPGVPEPPSDEELVREALSARAHEELERKADWRALAQAGSFDVVGGDTRDLARAGWGVIFAQDADPALREALRPLLDLRREQAGERYREFTGADGYRAGESSWEFLERHGCGPGPVDPRHMPYYLLLAGTPAAIPWGFQCQLHFPYAVGRVGFDDLDAYRRYAEGVLAVERGGARRPRRLAVFGPRNPDDHMAALAHDRLSKPLTERLEGEADYLVEACLAGDATRARLLDLLATRAPALLFTAGHGMSIASGSPHQRSLQGALVCQDWPSREKLYLDYAVCADDVPAEADLRGLVAVTLACFSAGMPRSNNCPGLEDTSAEQVAPEEFVAALAQRLLSHPAGPALAVVGHVDAAYAHGFKWLDEGDQAACFVDLLLRLMYGERAGRAFESFGQRYAQLGNDLTQMQAQARLGFRVDRQRLARTWQANRDARGYVLLGDPAVSVAAEDEQRARVAA